MLLDDGDLPTFVQLVNPLVGEAATQGGRGTDSNGKEYS
jgi:hypothetical protein